MVCSTAGWPFSWVDVLTVVPLMGSEVVWWVLRWDVVSPLWLLLLLLLIVEEKLKEEVLVKLLEEDMVVVVVGCWWGFGGVVVVDIF